MNEITFGDFLVTMVKALAGNAIRWAAMFLACGIAIGAMVRPDPVRGAVAFLIIGLLSPLWLRRARPSDGQ